MGNLCRTKGCHPKDGTLLQKNLIVDFQTEGEGEKFCGFAAQQHSLQKNLKIVHNGADFGIDFKCQGDAFLLGIQNDLRVLHCIVYPVVNVKLGKILVAHSAAAHIGFISQNESCGDGIDRKSRVFVMVSDGGDDSGNFDRGHSHLVQNAESHDGTGVSVVCSVDDIADIMHIGGDLRQLDLSGIVTQLGENIGSYLSAASYMGKGVLSKAAGDQRGIGLGNVGADLG